MSIFTDFSEFTIVAQQSPFALIIWIIAKTWVIFVLGGIFGFGIPGYLEYIRNRYNSKRRYTLLALDIPKNNEQSPKAVEQIFAQLSAISANPSNFEKWVHGVMPETFSFEIVSMGGYVQFLIHTPTQFRDLVEAAVYAQYSDAEIVEVEDYAQKAIGLKFPHDEYEMWGTEYVMTGKQHVPIRTYPEFEHSLSQEFKDPMAAMMETMTKIGPDEQIWLQLCITPSSESWKDGGERLVQKLIGAESKTKKTVLDRIVDSPIGLINTLGSIVGTTGGAVEKKERSTPNQLLYLTPGQRGTVEAIERKISKIGFFTKFRMIYIARKESFSKPRGVTSIFGAIKQFNIVGQNGFKASKTMTPNVDYFFKKMRNNARKNKILRQFRQRSSQLAPGYYGYILNIEELATIYHFPIMTVKAPLLKRIESKKSEPPSTLPIEEGLPFDVIEVEEGAEEKKK